MQFVNQLVWIFTSPTRVFEDIREGRIPWWQPWIWLSLLTMVATVLSLPIQHAVTELNSEMTQEQLDTIARFGWLQVLGQPLFVLLQQLLFAGITYVLVTILSSAATFRRYFTLTLFMSMIVSLGAIISSAVVRMRGVDTIRTIKDAQVSVGLGFLAPEGSDVLYGLLSSIDVFTIWSLAVLGLGLMHIFGMSRGQAIACVIPWWLISAALVVVGVALSGAS
jgi:hypothetical protein